MNFKKKKEPHIVMRLTIAVLVLNQVITAYSNRRSHLDLWNSLHETNQIVGVHMEEEYQRSKGLILALQKQNLVLKDLFRILEAIEEIN